MTANNESEDVSWVASLEGGALGGVLRQIAVLPAEQRRAAVADPRPYLDRAGLRPPEGAQVSLREQSFEVQNASATLPAPELLERLGADRSDVACISVVAPSTVIHARFLCTKLRAHFPALKIIVGLWGATERVAEATKRLHDSGADETVTSLAAAMQQIAEFSVRPNSLVAVTAAVRP